MITITTYPVSQLPAELINRFVYRLNVKEHLHTIINDIRDGIDITPGWVMTNTPTLVNRIAPSNPLEALTDLVGLVHVCIDNSDGVYDLYGYIRGDRLHLNTIFVKHDRGYTIHRPAKSISSIFDGKHLDLGYLLRPVDLAVVADALPAMGYYNFVDTRTTLLHDVKFSPTDLTDRNVYGATIVNDIQHLANSQSAYLDVRWFELYENLIPVVTPAMSRILDVVTGHHNPVWRILDDNVDYREGRAAPQTIIQYCLADLNTPLVTYDEEVQLHNAEQVNLLAEALLTL